MTDSRSKSTSKIDQNYQFDNLSWDSKFQTITIGEFIQNKIMDQILTFTHNFDSLIKHHKYLNSLALSVQPLESQILSHSKVLNALVPSGFLGITKSHDEIYKLLGSNLLEQLNNLALENRLKIKNPEHQQIESLQDELLPISSENQTALIETKFIPFQLISKIMQSPNELKNITPRQFEEFVAEVLFQLGFKNIILTPKTKDGGKDIIACNLINNIPISFYFECKHNSYDNKVKLGTLRTLLGTVSRGVLVTTSTFTKDSREFILSESRIDGKDYNGILGWIDELTPKLSP